MSLTKFSNNLRTVMNEKRITQAELARRTQIHPQNINKYLKGMRIPSAVIILRIAESLEINVNGLIGTTDPQINKDSLYKLFMKAFAESKEAQVFAPLDVAKIQNLLQVVKEFGGWEAVSDFLTEELHLRQVGEAEYQRTHKEIYEQLKNDSQAARRLATKTKKKSASRV